MLILEAFIVCQNYSPPEGYVPTMLDPLLDHQYNEENPLTGANRIVVPFVACGDLSGYDSDQTYYIDESYERVEAVQKPINPPYKAALEMKTNNTFHHTNKQTV